MSTVENSTDGRTMMTAVMFADLVGYSRKPVTDQLTTKAALRDLLQVILATLAPESRVVMDTGDGAAVAFLSDPEHALYFALRLRREISLRNIKFGNLQAEDLRLGVNLGPVRWVVDVNGRPNLLGDGINTAERVMSFAAPGETAVSRSFRDAVSCLHVSYQELFEAMGERADKHGCRHEVFRMRPSLEALVAATASLTSAHVPMADENEPAKVPAAAAPEEQSAFRTRRKLVLIAASVFSLVTVSIAMWYLRDQGANVIKLEPAPTASPNIAAAQAEPGLLVKPEPAGSPVPILSTVESESTVKDADPKGAGNDLNPASSTNNEVLASPERVETPPSRAARVKIAKSAQSVSANAMSSRCTLLLQRLALGAESTAAEQDEYKRSCR